MKWPGLEAVIAAIDAANALDPSLIVVGRAMRPASLVYGERMSARLRMYEPLASLELEIAVRGQHIERWAIPRQSFPEGRIGYLTWRKDLQRFHARRLGEIIASCGMSEAIAKRVGELVRKERLASDVEVQVLEDVACLVFIEHYFDPFTAGRTDEKLAEILAKTWRKMSDRAKAAVQIAPPPQRILDLLAAGLERSKAQTTPPELGS